MTCAMLSGTSSNIDFNPHEREARDLSAIFPPRYLQILIHTSVKLVTGLFQRRQLVWLDFNPHEREARDVYSFQAPLEVGILIHTSVKLVTSRKGEKKQWTINFNPHEREARD